MPSMNSLTVRIACVLAGALIAGQVHADDAPAACPVSFDQLQKALKSSVNAAGGPKNGGFENNEWAAVVGRDGLVCAIVFSGKTVGDQWPASRAIAVEKANTANGLSTNTSALSTANLYAAVQPGGPLFGAAATNPPDTTNLYAGVASTYGTPQDPLIGHGLGGVVVFGGGLALYKDGKIVGGLGASGDTSCADHNIAWRVRQALSLDKVPAGVTANKDAILYDIGADGKSKSGFGHPRCPGGEEGIGRSIGAVAESGK